MFFGRNHLHRLLMIALALIVVCTGRGAYADCANPTGVAGAMVYNTDHAVVQFCNGTNWVSTAGSTSSSQWTSTGNDIYYNNGGVAVGATSADASAILDLTSTTKGFLPPRMSTTQIGNIGTPAEGLVAYDMDTHQLKIRTNSAWVVAGSDTLSSLSCASGETAQFNGTAWVCSSIPASTGMNFKLNEAGWINTGATTFAAGYAPASAVIDGYIYLFGGYNGAAMTTIQRASLSTPTVWSNAGGGLSTATYGATAFISGSYIYVVGGSTTAVVQRALLSNPTSFSNVGNLPGIIGFAGTATIDGWIYIFGGTASSTGLTTIYRAPVSDPTTWTTASGGLATGVFNHNIAVIGDYIYSFGGNTASATSSTVIQRASVSAPTTWANVGNLPAVHNAGPLLIIGDYMYLIGGAQNSSVIATIYRASLADPLSWTSTPTSLPTPLQLTTGFIAGDHAYIVNGHNGSYLNTIFRAPITLGIRQTAPVALGLNQSWKVAYSANTGATQDPRIGNITNSKWCATNSSGTINCDQTGPNSSLATLSDVSITSPTNGQSLVFNSALSRWENGPGDALGSLSCASGETAQWNGTAWVCASTASSAGMNYRMAENSWVNTGATIPGTNHVYNTAVVGDYIYMFGGHNGSGRNSIWRAPLSNPTAWVDTGSVLPATFWQGNIAVIDGFIYLFGGYNGATLNTIYRASTSTPTVWSLVSGSTLPGPLYSSSLAVIGDYVYLFGGYGASAYTNVIYRAPVSNPTAWVNTGSTLPTTISHSQVMVIGDYVYLFGGIINGGYSNAIYRAPTNNPTAWSLVSGSTMPGAVAAGTQAIVGDYVYVIGGYNGSAYLNTIYRAPLSDPTTWSNTGHTLPSTAAYMQANVIGDAIYLFGGYFSSTYSAAIYRSPIVLSTRQGAAVAVGRNPSWQVAYSANTGATQDLRLNTLTSGKWCAVNASGQINCDQNAPSGTLAGLTDVSVASPSNGQSLVFNSTTSKWEKGPGDPLGSLSCASGETPQFNGTAWICAAPATASGINYKLTENGFAGTGASLPSALYDGASAVIGNNMYIFGGSTASSVFTANIYRASVNTPTAWSTVGTIPAAFASSAYAIVGDSIYLFGGQTGSNSYTTAIHKALLSNPTSWSAVGNIPVALRYSTAMVAGGYVYLLGGTNAGGTYNTIYRATVADPTTFTSVGTLPATLNTPQFAIIGDYAYIFGGGMGGATSAAIWRAPVTDLSSWTVMTGYNLPGPLSEGQAAIIGDYIYLLGGWNGSAANTNIYRAAVSDPLTWSNTGSTTTGAYGQHLFVVDDNVYLAGGYTTGYTGGIWRAPITMGVRQSAPVDVTKNHFWTYAYSTNTGATQDLRIGQLNNSKLCATNGSGTINCDVNLPTSTLAGLTDVATTSPTNGQSLVFNSTTAKWENKSADPLAGLSCASGETTQWNGTAWVCAAISASSGMNYKLEEDGVANTGSTYSGGIYGSATVIIDDYIYFYGGTTGSSVWINTISRAPVNNPSAVSVGVGTMPATMGYAKPFIYNGYIYLIAGWNGTNANTIYRAPLNNPTSVTLYATLPASASMTSIAEIDGYLYIFGGNNLGSYVANIYRAPLSDLTSWASAGSLPIAIGEAQIAVIGNTIYLFGGRNSGGALNTIYSASTSAPSTWTNTGSVLPAGNFYGSSAIIGDYIYMFGGYNGGGALSVIWRAPLSSPTTWTNTGYTIGGGLSIMNIAVVSDAVYLYGGYTGSASSATTIKRASITLGVRQGAPLDVGKNPATTTAYSTQTGAIQDLRIGTIGSTKWCAANAQGQINCDQTAPNNTLAGLTDVSALSPTGGQSLVFNGATSKWEAAAGDPLASLSCASGETPQFNGTTWVCASMGASSGLNYKLIENGFVNTGATFPVGMYTPNHAIIGGFIYVFGGEITNGSSATNIIYRASVDTPTAFTNVGTIPVALKGAAVAVIDGYVYLFGGNTGSTVVNTIYRAPVSNPLSWSPTSVGTLPGSVYQSHVVVVGNNVYMYGGNNGSGAVTSIWRASVADPTTWTNPGNVLPAVVNASQIAVIGNYIYMFGGYTGGAAINTIFRASTSDPLTVTAAGTLPGILSHSQMAIVGDYIYLMTGLGSGASNVLYRAPLSDPLSWTNTGVSLPMTLYGGMAYVAGDNLYFAAGYSGSYVTAIYRAPITMSLRQSTPIDVGKTASWRLAYSANTGAAQDIRIGTLTANNYCAANSGGTAIDCTMPSPIANDMLDFAQFKNAMTLDASTDIAASGTNVLSITNSGTGNSFVVNDDASDTTPFVIDANGNVGIGTSTPNVALDVAGAIVSRAQNAGSATTIDFTTSNVAYTSAVCGAFTISGMQDGGSYILVVKGNGTGPATFTHSGLTVKSAATFACTSAKHTVFALVRAGTDLYVSYITGY